MLQKRAQSPQYTMSDVSTNSTLVDDVLFDFSGPSSPTPLACQDFLQDGMLSPVFRHRLIDHSSAIPGSAATPHAPNHGSCSSIRQQHMPEHG